MIISCYTDVETPEVVNLPINMTRGRMRTLAKAPNVVKLEFFLYTLSRYISIIGNCTVIVYNDIIAQSVIPYLEQCAYSVGHGRCTNYLCRDTHVDVVPIPLITKHVQPSMILLVEKRVLSESERSIITLYRTRVRTLVVLANDFASSL